MRIQLSLCCLACFLFNAKSEKSLLSLQGRLGCTERERQCVFVCAIVWAILLWLKCLVTTLFPYIVFPQMFFRITFSPSVYQKLHKDEHIFIVFNLRRSSLNSGITPVLTLVIFNSPFGNIWLCIFVDACCVFFFSWYNESYRWSSASPFCFSIFSSSLENSLPLYTSAEHFHLSQQARQTSLTVIKLTMWTFMFKCATQIGP